MTQNQLKWVETSQNQVKMTQKDSKMTQSYSKFQMGKIWNFLLAFIFQFLSPHVPIWVFWAKKYQLFILMKCCLYPVSKALISNLTLLSKTLIPNAQIWAKKYQLSNIIKILQVAYFDGAYFKSVICFQKFWAQIPKFGHFGPKSTDFLIFCK